MQPIIFHIFTGFEDWPASDKEFYHFVSKMLRNWRATERQCSAIRRPITFFQNMKLQCRSNRQYHQTEMEAYRQTLRDFTPIPEHESFDLP